MKMRNLTGAIRKIDGPVYVHLYTSVGVLRVPLQKTGLLTALKDLPLDPQDETEMAVDATGVLTFAPAASRAGAVLMREQMSEQIDLEELTGDGSGVALPEIDLDAHLIDEDTGALHNAPPVTPTIDDDLAGLFG